MYINQPFWQTIRELTPSPVCCFYYTRVTGNKLEINIIVPFISINKTVGRLQVNTFNLQKKKKPSPTLAHSANEFHSDSDGQIKRSLVI